jgi:hypothetical protein
MGRKEIGTGHAPTLPSPAEQNPDAPGPFRERPGAGLHRDGVILISINARRPHRRNAAASTFAKGNIMSSPLFQTPFLIFMGMMAAFMLTLGPIALADFLRSRRD